MYRLKTEHSFDAAHFLAAYEGKCRNIHGHHWRVVTEVCGTELKTDTQNNGMLVDFSELKKDLRRIVDAFDHTLIIERGSISDVLRGLLLEENFSLCEMDFRPTAENFARYFFEQLSACGYTVARCIVYETETNCAEYISEGAGM